jgi:hypothetical protein
MDRVILGDNPFFGVNHMSEEAGMHSARRFQDTKAIIDVVDSAYALGVRGVSFSTHDRVREICDHFRADKTRYADLRLYPALPYAHKYADLVNERGVLGAVTDTLAQSGSAGGFVSTLMRGGMVAVRQDPIDMMKLLVDVELSTFRELKTPVIFLQNIVTDLLLGLGWKPIFKAFADHVQAKYDARAGFMTLNMPALVRCLREAGVERPVVCTAINRLGFQMNPNRAAYERALAEGGFDAVAMSIMAAGALRPEEAADYVCSLPNVRAVVFGASRASSIRQTREILEARFARQAAGCREQAGGKAKAAAVVSPTAYGLQSAAFVPPPPAGP